MQIDDPVTILPSVGPNYAQLLEKLNIFTIHDLLYYFPVNYRDTSKISRIESIRQGNPYTIDATISKFSNIRLRYGKSLQRAVLVDDSAEIEAIWFNQYFLEKVLKVGTHGLFSGKLNPKSRKPQFSISQYEVIKESETLHLGRIVPVYNLTEGLSLKWLRARIKWLIDNLAEFEKKGWFDQTDKISNKYKEKFSLIDLKQALRWIHFPENQQQIVSARRRLGIDELIDINLKLMKSRAARKQIRTKPIKVDLNEIGNFVSNLPFKLTKTQITSYKEIFSDFDRRYPMRRLLQGDVGSGKTIVAAIAAMAVVLSGQKALLLCPTTILAEQHFTTFKKLFAKRFKIGLKTLGYSDKSQSLIKIDILIGTHALLNIKTSEISNVGLVIVDEQHRFGVTQRRAIVNLEESEIKPHVLHLTATPIPRSIAMSLFGDFEISDLDKPSGRLEVSTHLVPNTKMGDAYSWIAEKARSGGQIFWVFPMIETNAELEAKSIEDEFGKIAKFFKDFKVAFIHGKFDPQSKIKVLEDFRKHQIDILVATTVVEVGLDIPDANVIVIENAERFGLAQLHQLRGRVGRNNQKAWCLLFLGEKTTEKAQKRCLYFSKQNNGLKIAQFDLELRGPGEVYGTIQSGIPNLKIARFSNQKQMEIAREIAQNILKQ